MSKTATKLPSKVKAIGDAAEALAKETGVKPGEKPVQTATSQLKSVTEPAQKAKDKIDPDNWKERYSRYKATTDTTISELRTTLATVQATLTSVQAQYQELLKKPDVSIAQPVVAANSNLSAKLTKDSPVYKKYLERLPESIKADYTEDYLFDQFVIQVSVNDDKPESKSSDLTALETKVDGIVEFQEKTRAELYEEEMDRAFPNDEWITLASGEEWNLFCSQRVSTVDQRTYGEIVKHGSDTHTAANVIWALNEFKAQQNTLEVDDTVDDTLLSQVTPEGAGGGGGDPIAEINAQAETFTQSQVTAFFTEVATTAKYSAEQAAAIEQSIIAAQAAGKIIPG